MGIRATTGGKTARTYLGAIRRLAIFFGALCLQIWPLFCYLGAFGPDRPWIGFIAYLVGGIVEIAIHELAHAGAALACGWRLMVIAIRPFILKLPTREVRVARRSTFKGVPGWVISVPRSIETATKHNWAIIVLAGPAASLFTALAAFGAAWFWLPRLSGPDLDASLIGTAFGLQALRSGLFTLLPHWRLGSQTDGDKFRALRKADVQWANTRALLWLNTLLSINVRLRDLPRWMIALAADDARAEVETYLDSVQIGIALDSEPVDARGARALIDRFREAHGNSEWLASCEAYLAAMWEGDTERARTLLWTGAASPEQTPLTKAAEAAVAAREGDAASARTLLKAMRKAVKAKSPFRNATFRDIDAQVSALFVATA